MARRSGIGGGMTALRAALGAVAGGLEGRSQQQSVEAEKKRMADAADRQAMLDALAMEDRAQAKEDRLRSQRERLLGGGYVREGMDMPGATPRKAVNTEMVGGERYSVYETPQQMARRAAIEEATLKAKFNPTRLPLRYTEGETGINVFNPSGGTSTFQPYAKGFTPKSTAGSGKAEPSDATKRQLGNQYMASQARNPALMAALQNTFSNDPEAAADPGLAAYDLMKSKMIPKLGAGKGYEPPKPSKAAAGDKLDQEVRDAVAARKAAMGATSPAAAPAAAKSTGQSDAIIDKDRYAKDADYRAWVDSQNK